MVAISVQAPHALTVSDPAELGALRAGEVLLQVERAGICGSDIHILHGSNPFARYPRVIGHEFAGRIEVLGPGVAGFRTGQRVVVDPVAACGHCYPCRIGRPNVCANLEVFGVHRDGGFRDRLTVPAVNCIAVPDDLSPEVAALAEPLSIAANVLTRTGISADDTVLQVAKLHGARCTLADIDPARLAIGFL
ncbi:alcohol dehydrogenase catalytic domain-containing protein [Methylobacterium variabile]|uniref:alcohol dehydrogenase catalytic domain-containing protein n=1 Tax=Methylobacterium variabile TaxID=298794 RepID=UPI0009FB8EB5|nr:alcohol dehydrogenase catalytic domain-containing protein [Methylobacterium variabile]